MPRGALRFRDACQAFTADHNVQLVNWELHHPRNSSPKWYQGARTAKLVLDKSDPGHRYHRPINVQSSHARQVLGNLIAMYDILSQVVCPLILDEIKNQYSWLLEGTEREVRRIVGLTGLSPKLLHIIGQISHLAARLNRDPDSTVVPVAGKIVEDRLRDFQQWSDLSEGHATAEDLMESCVMDENGKVSCAATVNELTAESYVAMAQIYLHCRLFRYGITLVTECFLASLLFHLLRDYLENLVGIQTSKLDLEYFCSA